MKVDNLTDHAATAHESLIALCVLAGVFAVLLALVGLERPQVLSEGCWVLLPYAVSIAGIAMLAAALTFVVNLTTGHTDIVDGLAHQLTTSLHTPLATLLARSELLAAHANALWTLAGRPAGTAVNSASVLDAVVADLFSGYRNTTRPPRAVQFGSAEGHLRAVRAVGGSVCRFERNTYLTPI